jgi:hypothetical protein
MPGSLKQCVYWSLLFGATLALSGCLKAGGTPKDNDGNRAEDVARMFVEAVQAGDFDKAATYWRKADVKNIEANSNMPFKDFCLYFFKCDSFKITLMRKDKKSHVVAFRGQQEGREKTFGLFLQRIDGKWRLLMEKFIQDSESVSNREHEQTISAVNCDHQRMIAEALGSLLPFTRFNAGGIYAN